jgi:hypothetical protein
MIKKMLFRFMLSCFLLLPAWVQAQVTDPEKAYTAFDMRKNGKIYVLVACMLVILFGLILYLFRLDRRILKMEKEIDHKP